jgi:hypothetical protein
MKLNAMSGLWLRTGLIWFLVTMMLGMYLGMTKQFGMSSPHAHLGLLGWLSSAAFALVHAVADPAGELTRRGRVHWVAHNIGLVVQVSSLWLVLKTGDETFGMFIALGGLILIISTLGLLAMVWLRLGGAPAERHR